MLLFAGLAEALGRRVLEVDAPPTVGDLVTQLLDQWPELSGRPFRVAVDRQYADDDASLVGAEEVALIPPVSGG